jgi:hypothetical protein
MSTHKVLQLADKFAAKTTIAPPAGGVNQRFQEQRQKLSEFYDHFFPELRRVIARMENEIGTLRLRGFEKKTWKMMIEVYDRLITISKHIKEDKPYSGARELVEFALSRNTKSIIDNLDFLANHHLSRTNVDFKESEHLTHPKSVSLKQLIHLAEWARQFMDLNPLLNVPSSIPPAMPLGPVPVVTISPEEKADPGQLTNPAIPLAKRREDAGQ